MMRIVLFLFIVMATSLSGTELKPWFGPQLENEFRARALYESFRKVSEGSHEVKDSSDDLFFTLGLSNSPLPEISFEAEGTVARTRHKSNGFDNLRLTGRYLWFDDVAGDPFSFTTGLTVTKAFQGSLHDIASFHHGLIEAEFHAVVGKERHCDEQWISRWYLVAALGIAERGSPWLRGNFDYDWRLSEQSAFKCFINTLWGFGRRDLHIRHFKGYGPIRHQSVDLGLRYTYEIDFLGELSFEYAYRPYALNFPMNTHSVMVELFYPFAL